MRRTSRRRWIIPWILLMVFVNGLFLVLPMGSYDAVVIHHSASESGDIATLRRAHRARGWFEIAYHLVMLNGRSGEPAGSLFPTWRYRLGLWSVATRSPAHNLGSIHLCVIGNYEQRAVPEQLRSALGNALAQIQRRYDIPDSRILLHRDCSPTACPGRHIDRSALIAWKSAAKQAPDDLRRRHTRALDRAGLGPLSRGLLWSGLNLLFFALLMRFRSPAGNPAEHTAPAFHPAKR